MNFPEPNHRRKSREIIQVHSRIYSYQIDLKVVEFTDPCLFRQ